MFVHFKQGETKLPIKIWQKDLNSIEEECLKQAENLSNLPFAFHHIALCPDSHSGFGMPIGGVAALENAIIPFCVGSDIGCGVISIKTPWNFYDIPDYKLKKIMGEIRKEVPVGFSHHKHPQSRDLMPVLEKDCPIVEKEYISATKQLGTLGGGKSIATGSVKSWS